MRRMSMSDLGVCYPSGKNLSSVDLRHNRHQSSEMPKRANTRNSLFITRHATQDLLREAFNALPSTTHGLLSGQHGVIQEVYPLSHHHLPDPPELAKHIQALELRGLNLLSLYVSSATHNECMETLRDRALQTCSASGVNKLTRLLELPLVVVRLDTKGRMDVVLLGKGDKTELPLLLQEDEQTIPRAG